MDEQWLHDYIVEVVRGGVCAKIHCTTCGTVKFRSGLLNSLAKATGEKTSGVIDQRFAGDLLAALAQVLPRTNEECVQFEEPVRCIFFDLWQAGVELEPYMIARLSGTWAGEVLARMRAHYNAVLASRRASQEFNDPINIQRRRSEAKRLKREQHAVRLENKKERDRFWFSKLPHSDS